MKHALSEPYYTYANHALGHYSTIDHCITTRNIFDRIIKCYVRCDPLNPSNHNIIDLSITCLHNDVYACTNRLQSTQLPKCAWDKADSIQIDNYRNTLNNKLSAINLSNDLVNCKDLNCKSLHHKSLIDMFCSNLIDCCLQSGYETLPQIESKNRTVPGWSVEIKHVREQSLFWHWIWSEAGILEAHFMRS